MTMALDGVRVLDVTTSVAGPYCTLILSALGAEVIKVEHPERGDDTRGWGPPFWDGHSATFLALNAGKRSLAINIKSPDGREALARVAAGCDVFVQNLRPGLAERLGLGFDALRERNERIVYCAIGAFGKAGPKRDLLGYDPLMQAAGGIMSITGEPGRPNVRAGVSVVDQGAGMWAAIGILAALRQRDVVGAGAQLVDTSLYETAVNWLPYQLVGYLGSGRVPAPQGSGIAIVAPYQAYDARDRRIMVAAGNDRQFAALCGALGRADLARDPRFASNADRVANREALSAALSERFAEADAATWLEVLAQAGVPAAPVQDVGEVADDAQTAALEILQPLGHPHVRDLRVVAPPLSFDGERAAFRTAPPLLGEHSAAVLAAAGYRQVEIEKLQADGVIAGTRADREEVGRR